MKHTFTLALFLLLIACSSDSNPEDGLPKETQTGANTFGCLIDGKLLVPRSGNNNIVNPEWGAIIWGSGDANPNAYKELEVRDLKSPRRASFLLHMKEVAIHGIGDYIIDESNGLNSTEGGGLNQNYIHCVIFDKTTNSYQQYVSYENSGLLKITFYNPSAGVILSGTFNCKVRNIQNPNDEIEITNGRFDVKPHNLMQTYFP